MDLLRGRMEGMKSLDQAAAALRVRQLAMDVEHEALETVLTELFRYREALRFYAAPKNYLDSVPMFTEENGLMLREDDGLTARVALRLDDYVLPFTHTKEEGNVSSTDAG